MKVSKLSKILIVFVTILIVILTILSFAYAQKEDENSRLNYYIDYVVRHNCVNLILYNDFDWGATDYREYMLDKSLKR